MYTASPVEMRQRGRIGAHTKWALCDDRTAATATARNAARTKLEQRLIEEFTLDPTSPEFDDRLAHARSAHFARLALKSAAARRKGGRG